jgi:hypothetical protein
MVVLPCAIGTKLEPICGREAASAAGSPAEPVLSLSKDEIPIPPSGRGTCRQMRPFFAFSLRLVACGLLLFFSPVLAERGNQANRDSPP